MAVGPTSTYPNCNDIIQKITYTVYTLHRQSCVEVRIMRRTGIPGTRSWLIAQMQHGIHVEECATVRHERSMMPSAVVLQDDAICGVYKPHNESLQEVLSSGSDISISFEIQLRDIVDIKVRQDFMAHREKINGKQCPEVVYIFYSYDEEDIASCTNLAAVGLLYLTIYLYA